MLYLHQIRNIIYALVRNADGVDYLGYMAVARDFSKQPQDMQKAVAALKSRKKQFYSIIDFESAKVMAEPCVAEAETIYVFSSSL